MNFWKVTTDNVEDFAWIDVKTKRGLGTIPGERHNEDEIHLKALPEQIFFGLILGVKTSETHK